MVATSLRRPRKNQRKSEWKCQIEQLERRELLTISPAQIHGLSAGTSAIYAGDTFTLTATGVVPGTNSVTGVEFFIDDGDGKFDAGDRSLGSDTSGSDGWSLSSIPTTGTYPIAVGKQLFFAEAIASDGPGNAVAFPAQILSSGPILEPIDNDDVVAGREYVLSPKVDWPLNATPATVTYAVKYYVGTTDTSLPTGVEFHTDTGTMIWEPTAGQKSTTPYHFRMIATAGSNTSSRDFYLTVQQDGDVLTPAQNLDGTPWTRGNALRTFGPYFSPYSSDPSGLNPTLLLPTTSRDYLNPYGGIAEGPQFGDLCGCATGDSAGTGGVTEDIAPPPPPSPLKSLFLSKMINNAGTNPHPIIEADLPLVRIPDGAKYLSATAELTYDDASRAAISDTVVYTLDGINSCQYFHLALPIDATDLPTDHYQLTLHIKFLYSSGGLVWDTDGTPHDATADIDSDLGIGIVNRIHSPVGDRWGLDNLDQLVIHDADGSAGGGVLLVEGGGAAHWFERAGSTDVYEPYGSTHELHMEKIDGKFRLTSPDTSYEEFDGTTGKLADKVDSLGNQTTYSYYISTSTTTGALADALHSIEEVPTHRTQTFKYDGHEKLSTVTDFAGRITTLGYSSDGLLLTSITLPNPDGGGAGGPTRSFGYDSYSLLTSETNELGETTHYEYDAFHRLTRTIYPDGSYEILQSTATANVAQRVLVTNVGGPAYLGTLAHPAPLIPWNVDGSSLSLSEHGTPTYYGPIGRIVDPAGNVIHFTSDPQGAVTSTTQPVVGSDTAPWAAGPTTFHVANYLTGLIQLVISPSPSDSSSPDRQIVETQYDTETFVPITVTHANDGSVYTTETWTYENDSFETNVKNYPYTYTVSAPGATSRVTTFHYNDDVLLDDLTDPEGNHTYFTYTTNDTDGVPAGLLKTETDPNGSVTTYAYWAVGDSTGLSDPSAAYGRVKSITVSDGATTPHTAQTKFKYDQWGNMKEQTDPAGRVTDYTYDALNRLVTTQQMGFEGATVTTGPASHIDYDPLGLPTDTIDPNGNRTDYLHDLRDQLAAIIQPATYGDGALPGPETVYYNTPNSQVDTVIDPLGRKTQYKYDHRDQLSLVSDPKPTSTSATSPQTAYTYFSNGQLKTATDDNGNISGYAYGPGTGWLQKVTSVHLDGATIVPNNSQSDGAEMSYTYDSFGEVLTETQPVGTGTNYTTTMTYDKLGRVKTVTAPGPATAGSAALETDYVYDDTNSSQTVIVDPSGLNQTTTRKYDYLGRLISVEQPIPGGGADHPTTTYTYSTDFKSMTMTDPGLNKTIWSYDGFGRLSSVDSKGYNSSTTPDTDFGSRSYEYDKNGNVTKLTDRNGYVTQYTYDTANRLHQENWMDGSTVTNTETYFYDDAGQLTSALDSSASYYYGYDGDGRQTNVNSILWDAPQVNQTSQFDGVGNRKQLDASILQGTTTTPDFENAYIYDGLNRMTGITQTNQTGTGHNAVAYKQVGFGYNDANQLKLINRFNHTLASSVNPADPGATINASTGTLAQSKYVYDPAGNLSTLDQIRADSTHDTLTWTYDTANKVQTFKNTADGATAITYGYDHDNQLTSSTAITGVSARNYTYDLNGNRTSTNSVSSTIGAGNRLTNDGTYTYTYDAEGNTKTRTDSSDNVRVFKYDYRNRLLEVVDHAGSIDGDVTQDVGYAYDAFDRRVSRTVTSTVTIDGAEGNDATTETHHDIESFVYDGDHVVLDFMDPNGHSGTPATLKSRYLYGPAIDQVLAQETIDGSTSSTYWLAADNQGTIRDVVDNTGTLVTGGHFKYDAFGNVLSGDTTLGRYFFTGRELDILTGLQYNRERWYDPKNGRFITQDPIGFADGPNTYIYVHDSPTSATDPTGLAQQSQCEKFLKTIKNIEADIEKRLKQYAEDKFNLPESAPGDDVKPSLSRRGHRQLINNLRDGLNKLRKEYNDGDCGCPPNGKPLPEPKYFPIPWIPSPVPQPAPKPFPWPKFPVPFPFPVLPIWPFPPGFPFPGPGDIA